jgi:hypothetical protein
VGFTGIRTCKEGYRYTRGKKHVWGIFGAGDWSRISMHGWFCIPSEDLGMYEYLFGERHCIVLILHLAKQDE